MQFFQKKKLHLLWLSESQGSLCGNFPKMDHLFQQRKAEKDQGAIILQGAFDRDGASVLSPSNAGGVQFWTTLIPFFRWPSDSVGYLLYVSIVGF